MTRPQSEAGRTRQREYSIDYQPFARQAAQPQKKHISRNQASRVGSSSGSMTKIVRAYDEKCQMSWNMGVEDGVVQLEL
jgi:hypothetical protein